MKEISNIAIIVMALYIEFIAFVHNHSKAFAKSKKRKQTSKYPTPSVIGWIKMKIKITELIKTV